MWWLSQKNITIQILTFTKNNRKMVKQKFKFIEIFWRVDDDFMLDWWIKYIC